MDYDSRAMPPKRLTVLQLSRWLSTEGGGVQTYLSAISQATEKYNVDLKYAALMPGITPQYVTNEARLGKEKASKLRNAIELNHWLNKALYGIDVVHIHGATDWHFIVGAMACLRRGTPYLIRPAGGLFPEALSHTRRRRLLGRWFLKLLGLRLMAKSYSVIASSPREEELFRKLDPRLKVCIIPNGVSVPRKAPRPTPLGTPPLRLLFLGRISPIKELSTLMRAVARLQAQKKNLRLDIVGSGDSCYIGELQHLAEQLDIAGSVVWHGYKVGEEKLTLLQQSHVLVLPSLSENFGFVVAEAMAAGLPVVVSDGVGIAEQVRHYGAGAVFPVGNYSALADKISVYFDSAEIRACSERAYRCVKNEFSVEAMGENLIDIYRRAAGSAERIN